ncbi:MAG: hypothetical protein JWM80_1038 [Cyanobacteria bacterium RYN_339]|nr:hypothetical protein [Cyanobacteria bacterium RYN_339]
MGDEKKPNLFDKLKSAVDQVMPGHGGASADAKRKAQATKPGMADAMKLTDRLGKAPATGQLATAPNTQRLKQTGPADEELSPRRLAMIDDYMRGEAKIEQMNDPAYMYKIVSDERAYQTRLLMEFRKQFGQLGKTAGPEAEALQAKIRRAQAIVQNLFKVLKRITGKQGHTGGTDFLSEQK